MFDYKVVSKQKELKPASIKLTARIDDDRPSARWRSLPEGANHHAQKPES